MRYRWTWVMEVDADEEVEAQQIIEDNIDDAYRDPDGPFSYGEMKEVKE